MKPREFKMAELADREWLIETEDSLMKLKGDNVIHVREVIPIDWEKIWKEFDAKPLRANQGKIQIQELVEKALKGEL